MINYQLSMAENNGHFIDHWVLTIDHRALSIDHFPCRGTCESKTTYLEGFQNWPRMAISIYGRNDLVQSP